MATPIASSSSPLQARNYISGHWRSSTSERMLERRNPADLDDFIGDVPLSSRNEMRDAVSAAAASFEHWSQVPAPARGKILLRVATLLESQKEDFARLITREEGKPLADARGEVQRAINILEYIAGEGRRLTGETLPSEISGQHVYTVRVPLGVAGLITPWNFPLTVPVWKLAPALVCGNGVVWKPSELTPFSSERLCELFMHAGLPAGVLNMVHGGGEEVGDALVSDDRVSAISFTGSTEVGSAIYAKAAAQLKRVQCEMGGKNAVIVLADADLVRATDCISAGAFGSSGQRCTATSRAVVIESVADRLVQLLIERARKLRVGNGLEDGVSVGPLVDESQYEKVQRYIEIGKAEAELVYAGETSVPQKNNGYFVAPTIFDKVPRKARIAQEEIFGPVLSVIRVRDLDEALEVANETRFGLAGAVFTRDLAAASRASERFTCGMLHINSPTVGGEAHVPFGGMKGSGIGDRECGSTAIDFYSELKVVYVDYR